MPQPKLTSHSLYRSTNVKIHMRLSSKVDAVRSCRTGFLTSYYCPNGVLRLCHHASLSDSFSLHPFLDVPLSPSRVRLAHTRLHDGRQEIGSMGASCWKSRISLVGPFSFAPSSAVDPSGSRGGDFNNLCNTLSFSRRCGGLSVGGGGGLLYP